MPIVRTYACPECNHMMEVTLTAEQWDTEPPYCPRCVAWDFQHPMKQEFRPVALGGSPSAKAHAIAEDIAANDYHVADMTDARKEGDTPKVRYKDQTSTFPPSTWTALNDTMQSAVAIGRETRLRHGNGLDVLQSALKSGAQPDLIEASKRRAIKVF